MTSGLYARMTRLGRAVRSPAPPVPPLLRLFCLPARALLWQAGLLVLLCLPGAAAATTVTGTVKLPDGTPVNGTIEFLLSQRATTTTPPIIFPPMKTTCTITAGVIQSCTVQGNDTLSPAGTFYKVTLRDNNNRPLGPPVNYTLTGASVDIGTLPITATDTLVPPAGAVTGNLSVTGNVAIGGASDLGLYSDADCTNAPAAPGANHFRLYCKTDKLLYFKNDTGVESQIPGTASANTWTADQTFSAAVAMGNQNGSRLVDGVKYPRTRAGIQSALNDAGGVFNEVVLSCGIYDIDSTPITISNTRTTLRGSGLCTRLQVDDPTVDLFDVTGAVVTLRDFSVDITAATNRTGCLFDLDAQGGSIENVRMVGTAALNNGKIFCLDHTLADNWTFSRIYIPGGVTWEFGWHLQAASGTAADNIILGSKISNTVTWSNAAVILDTGVDTFVALGTSMGGIGTIYHLKNALAGQAPRYVRVIGGGGEASSTGTVFLIDDVDDFQAVGVYAASSLRAADINGGRGISFLGGHYLTFQQEAFRLDGGTGIVIGGGMDIRDASQQTNKGYPVIAVGAGVSDFSLDNISYRKRATAINIAQRFLAIASGASDRYHLGFLDAGVPGTDYGNAGDRAVDDAATGTNVVLADRLGTLLHRGNAAITHTGTAAETNLITHTLKAGSLGLDDGLRLRVAGTTANGATPGAKTIRLYFGTQVLSTCVVASADTHSWWIDADVFNANSQSAQTYGSLCVHTPNDADGGAARVKSAGASVATTGDVTVKVSGQLGDSGDSIVINAFDIRPLRRQ